MNDRTSTMGTATRAEWRAWTLVAVNIFCMIVFSGMAKVASAQSSPPKARALFVFGDPWADTGNQNKSLGCWQHPYGETWPGRPTGRCGNGHIQTDFLADIIGLPTPTSFVNSAVKSIATGINFAIAGSSITYAVGVLPLGTQVDNFELVQQSGVYGANVLSQSLGFVSIVGNDFTENLTTRSELLEIAQSAVEGITLSLRRLYELGLRNFLVSNLAPLNCLPTVTKSNNFTYCPTATDPIIAYQNNLLEQNIAELNRLPGGNFLILDNFKAFSDVLNNSVQYGLTEKFMPCCAPLAPNARCGSRDASGNPLYTLCDDPATHTLWDLTHPVESTWKDIINHFAYSPGFVLGAPTLRAWLEQNKFRPALSPGPAPVVPIASVGAAGELDRAYEALINQTDYSESVGLLRGMNLEGLVTNLPAQMVTIFLPDNLAYTKYPQSFLDQIYGDDKVLSVATFHVVEGYFDRDRLAISPPMNFTTISGLQLMIDPTPSGILVGPSPARVVGPDLYTDPSQVVIHGIDNILVPPNLGIS